MHHHVPRDQHAGPAGAPPAIQLDQPSVGSCPMAAIPSSIAAFAIRLGSNCPDRNVIGWNKSVANISLDTSNPFGQRLPGDPESK